jgi:hypothetical protein
VTRASSLDGVGIAICLLLASAPSGAAQPATPPADPRTGATGVDSNPPPRPPEQADDPGETVQGRTVRHYLDALRSRDLAAVRKLLSPGFEFPTRWYNCPAAEGPTDCFIRFLRETMIDVDGRVDLQKIRVEWHIVRINVSLSNRLTRDERADRVLLTDEFLVEGGRIASFIRTPRTEDPQTRSYYQSRWFERPFQ